MAGFFLVTAYIDNMAKMAAKDTSIKRNFAILAFIAFVLMFSALGWHIRASEQNKIIISKLEAESSHIENALTGAFEYTGFVMKNLTKQIAQKPDDKEYINSILSNYRINPNVFADMLSWTIFSWADTTHFIIVDAVYGIMKEPFDLNDRDYIPMTEKYPDTLQLGKPVFGSTSKRWMIPAGVGVNLKGKYIGTLTIGFDLKSLMDIANKSLKEEGVEFAIIDPNLDVIIRSSPRLTELGEDESNLPEGELKEHLREAFASKSEKQYSNAGVLDGESYFFKKMETYPYIIYTRFKSQKIKQLSIFTILRSEPLHPIY